MSENQDMREVLEVFAGRCPPTKTFVEGDEDFVFVAEAPSTPAATEFADA
ncbi:MAG: hypothetical protein AAGC66_12060 [Leifsonia sp.]